MKNRKFLNSGVCCLLTSLCLLTGCTQKAPEEAEAMSQESIVAALAEPAETEKDGIQIRADSYDEISDIDRFVGLTVHNQSNETFSFGLENRGLQVNGFWISGILSPAFSDHYVWEVQPGETNSFELKLIEDELRYAGIDNVGTLQFQLNAKNEENDSKIVFDPIRLETTSKDKADGYDLLQEEPLYSDENVQIEYLGCTESGSESRLIFCIHNQSDHWIKYKFKDLIINDSISSVAYEDGNAAPHAKTLASVKINSWSTDSQIGSSGEISRAAGELSISYSDEGDSWFSNADQSAGMPSARTVSFDVEPDFSSPVY